jgi:pimeloyl-ACP methyl ester carboxylesterase
MYDEEMLSSLPAGEEEYVKGADGNQIHCVSDGDGPTVVLAHGYLLELTVFNIVFRKLLGQGFRVIAFDQRGHGSSTAGANGCTSKTFSDDYRAVLDHYQVEQGILVGHSMGAFIAIVFCLNHPEVAFKRLRRLVFLGGTAGAVAQGSLPNRLQIPILKTGILKTLWRRRVVGRALIGQYFGLNADPRFIELMRSMLLRQNVKLTLPVLRAMLYENYYDRLHQIPIEARVICGEKDVTCPRWHSEKLGQNFSNATTTWVPNVGHMLSYEAPSVIIDAIL